MLTIAPLNKDNLQALLHLDAASFLTPWKPDAFLEELSHTEGQNWGAFHEEDLIGALLTRKIGDEWWIMRTMVHPKCRRQNIALKLLRELYQKIGNQEPVWLEVAANNQGAIAFYQSEGFEEVGKRKGYYAPGVFSEKPEDALVMKRESSTPSLDYELLDFGEGYKWERVGNNRVIRPQNGLEGKPQVPRYKWEADAVADLDPSQGVIWKEKDYFVSPWRVNYGELQMELSQGPSRNIGIFPEQVSNWDWLRERIRKSNLQSPRVLNLFAYTGMASLVCAQAGAQVCHVDASSPTVRKAKQAQSLNPGLEGKIRFITDDAEKFVRREIRRGAIYDALILDPPPVGRWNKQAFNFSRDTERLLELCKVLLPEQPLFVLLNCYAINYTSQQVKVLLETVFQNSLIEKGELSLVTQKQPHKRLSLSVYARLFTEQQ